MPPVRTLRDGSRSRCVTGFTQKLHRSQRRPCSNACFDLQPNRASGTQQSEPQRVYPWSLTGCWPLSCLGTTNAERLSLLAILFRPYRCERKTSVRRNVGEIINFTVVAFKSKNLISKLVISPTDLKNFAKFIRL